MKYCTDLGQFKKNFKNFKKNLHPILRVLIATDINTPRFYVQQNWTFELSK